MKDSTALYGAADYIRKYGWQVNSMGFHGATRCMLGALESALFGVADYIGQSAGVFSSTMRTLEGVTGCPVTVFNDTFCKTADDAIAALEIAADIAAAEGR